MLSHVLMRSAYIRVYSENILDSAFGGVGGFEQILQEGAVWRPSESRAGASQSKGYVGQM